MLYYAMMCYAILCYAMLCYTMLYYAMLTVSVQEEHAPLPELGHVDALLLAGRREERH
jgi:hypothetical protein